LLIGSAAAISAEQARAQARTLLGKVVLGRDPQAEKAAQRLRDSHSLKSVVDDYLSVKKELLRPNSLRGTKLYLTGKAYFGPLHTVPISVITRADVSARLETIKRTRRDNRLARQVGPVQSVPVGAGRRTVRDQSGCRHQQAEGRAAARPCAR
jgi:hypothetical protein